MLTDDQVSHFRTFGFLVTPGALSTAEMDRIGPEFDEVMSEARNGESFTGEETQTMLWCVEQRKSLSWLAEDDRIYGAMEQLLGPGFIWVVSDGNLYVGDTQWHGGVGDRQILPHVKVAIYPDRVTADTGSLRVIPGSHLPEYQVRLKGLRSQFEDADERPFGLAGAEVPAFPLESTPGDVVFFSENIWHGSFGGGAGRRMFTLIYYANPETEEQQQYVRDQHKKLIAMFNPHESFLNSDRPRIRGMVQKYVELGVA